MRQQFPRAKTEGRAAMRRGEMETQVNVAGGPVQGEREEWAPKHRAQSGSRWGKQRGRKVRLGPDGRTPSPTYREGHLGHSSSSRGSGAEGGCGYRYVCL